MVLVATIESGSLFPVAYDSIAEIILKLKLRGLAFKMGTSGGNCRGFDMF